MGDEAIDVGWLREHFSPSYRWISECALAAWTSSPHLESDFPAHVGPAAAPLQSRSTEASAAVPAAGWPTEVVAALRADLLVVAWETYEARAAHMHSTAHTASASRTRTPG
ncbi:hypothetical protein [Cellulomonas sp. URHB0016]